MSARTAALHTPAELRYHGCDETTGIVEFVADSRHRPGHLNTVSLDTTTGAILCDCKGAQCDRPCWHADHVAAAWAMQPALNEVRWLSDARLTAYGRKLVRFIDHYRATGGRALPMDMLNLIAARCEYRRRAACAAPALVAQYAQAA